MKHLKKYPINEDVYYPEDKPEMDNEKEIEEIVEKLIDEYIGLDAAYYHIRYGGSDIEVGSKTPTIKIVKIRKERTQEWQDVADELIYRLQEIGSLGWEIELIGYSGFRMSTK